MGILEMPADLPLIIFLDERAKEKRKPSLGGKQVLGLGVQGGGEIQMNVGFKMDETPRAEFGTDFVAFLFRTTRAEWNNCSIGCPGNFGKGNSGQSENP
jgi:hypothetical protein